MEGVAKLLGWRDGPTIAELCKGLTFGQPRRLSNEKSSDASKSSFTSQSTNQLGNMILNDGTKRKNGAGGGPSSKKSRSNSQRSNLNHVVQADEFTQPAQMSSPIPEKEKLGTAS